MLLRRSRSSGVRPGMTVVAVRCTRRVQVIPGLTPDDRGLRELAAGACRRGCGGARRRTRPGAAPCGGRAGRGRGRAPSSAVSLAPGRCTTNAASTWPNSSSGTPTTATSATAGWCREQLLDLDREDVLAARDDHVVVAPVDEQQPAVEVAEVAGGDQAALIPPCRRRRCSPRTSSRRRRRCGRPPRRDRAPSSSSISTRTPSADAPGRAGARRARSSGVATVATATSVEP